MARIGGFEVATTTYANTGAINLDDITRLWESVRPTCPTFDTVVCHPMIAGAVSRTLRDSVASLFSTNLVQANLCKQVRFPRTRKKRIQKKWARNTKNFAADTKIYLLSTKRSRIHA